MGVKFVVTTGVVSGVIALLLLNVTNPTAIGPLGILIFFISVYIALICFSYVALFIFRKVLLSFLGGGKKAALESVPNSKLYYYATVIALMPVIFLGMQSVGTVGVFEAVLLILFELLACFFIHKRY